MGKWEQMKPFTAAVAKKIRNKLLSKKISLTLLILFALSFIIYQQILPVHIQNIC